MNESVKINGNLALMREDYREAAEFYEKAFALLAESGTQDKQYSLLDWKDTEATYRYHAAYAWALAGNKDAALRNLEKAWAKGSFRQGGY
jgi:tetratricopeptide (TPR) repeat protein